MDSVAKLMAAPGRVVLSQAQSAQDARFLTALARAAGGWVLHICRDDGRMMALADAIGFFDPDLPVLQLPAWDTVPYDRVSPNAEICARRMDVLSKLAIAVNGEPRILLTTVNAALQRMPSRDAMRDSSMRITVGETIDLDALLAFLQRSGFVRTGTVMEPGEFAARGGIVDVYPPGAEAPVRLDFFGDMLEGVRVFDALSQRTIGKAEEVALIPISEVPLSEEAVTRFRRGYRELFGAVTDEDPLYAAVSEKRKFAGTEHWLPLFHEAMESVFDYLPEAIVMHDPSVEQGAEDRLAQIADYYQARVDAPGSRYGDAAPYKPLPPDRLYMTAEEWSQAQAGRRGGAFTPYQVPPAADVIDLNGHRGRNFAQERAQSEFGVFDALRRHVADAHDQGARVVLGCFSQGSADRLAGLLDDHDLRPVAPVGCWRDVEALSPFVVGIAVLPLESGYSGDGLVLIAEQDLLGDRLVRRRRSKRAENFLSEASQLTAGDLVVHVDHGIGRYEGLQTIEVGGAPHDCLRLTYEGDDRLFVPVENIEVLSRFGSEDASANLDRLGGANWQARKARMKQRIRDMADKLIKVAAERVLQTAAPIDKPSEIYNEFCTRFPFDETDDQLGAIDDVFDDLAAGTPMDRLICGDVGFGKTEVALRAALAAVMAGGQVAVVTPTTLLCRQHFRTFSQRFAGLPINVGQLSRLVTGKDATAVRAGIADGSIDIVVGTHALLGKQVKLKNLTLLIVDEEQHFGVAHKERLKQLKANVHVLTLTATPIPRTLQLAFSGIKDLSLIATPPVDRLAVRTFVMPFDPVVAREAILREHVRGGQVFYVCPRIADLPEAEEFLREHVPEVKYVTAHGRMAAGQLEDVMSAFYEGAYDVLVSTTIVESGLDIPTANTLIVHRADMFGLSQLYQLRGRIGRSKVRAYAYFTLPAGRRLTEQADKRLKVLQALDTLGAGFSLASHDLDIRGAGNLLGEEQSGHIKEVGVELYHQMLEEALALARSGEAGAIDMPDQSWSPQINLGTSVLIPEEYVSDLTVRLGLYRRLALLEEQQDIEAFAAELIDRFGSLPEEVDNLLAVVGIKVLCRQANVERLDAGPRGATLSFRNNTFDNPSGLVGFINDQRGTAKLRPDHKLVYQRQWDTPKEREQGVRYLVGRLAAMVQAPAASSAA